MGKLKIGKFLLRVERALSVLIITAFLLIPLLASGSTIEAERQIRAGDLSGAIKTLTSLTQREPGNVPAHLLLGNIFFELRAYPRAVAEYRKILRIDPSNVSALTNAGVALREMGDSAGSIQYLEKAESANPQFLPAHENLAVLYDNVGDLKREIAEYNMILRLHPNSTKTLIDLAGLYEKNKQYPQAENIYKDYLRKNPGDAEAWANLSELLLAENNRRGAWQSAERALALEPSRIKILMIHAKAGLALNSKAAVSAAADDAQKALAMDPTNSEASRLFIKAREKLLEKKQKRLVGFLLALILILAAGVFYIGKRKKEKEAGRRLQLSRWTAELDKLNEIDEIGEFLLVYFSNYFDLPSGIFFLINPEKTAMKSVYSNQKVLLADTVGINPAQMDLWLKETRGRPVTVTQLFSSSRSAVFPDAKEFFDNQQIRVLMPFSEKGKPLAVLALGGIEKTDFRKRISAIRSKTDFGMVLAEKASAVIERSMLYELSVVDEQTKVYNKRHFRRLLSDEIKRVERYHQPASLLMIDIDRFKTLNDSYGHQAGDSVLKEIADVLKENVRSGMDSVSRYGGEEFTIILSVTPVAKAVETAERIRVSVSERRFSSIPPDERVTISVGVATFPEHANSDWELIQSADKALYISKKNGRNQVSIGAHEEVKPAALRRTGEPPLSLGVGGIDKTQFEAMLAKAGAEQRSLSIVYFAQDNPSAKEGQDSPLSRVTGLLKAMLTESVAFSLNPRSMIFLIPDRKRNEAAEMVHEMFEQVKKNSANMDWNELGIRAGVAAFPQDGKTLDLLLSKAQSAWNMARTKGVTVNPAPGAS